MNCLICNNNTQVLFQQKILNKYDVRYFQCNTCNFIQTETPYWLDEAYADAITQTDIGLVRRNLLFAPLVEQVIVRNFDVKGKFLDYGGGYGLFVRMMRDQGLDFYRQDTYCENLFANFFDVTNLPTDRRKFELVTAFEVFEHLSNPMEDIKNMLTYADNVLFSTELQPTQQDTLKQWDYLAPYNGQHIALYHIDSLKKIAELLGMHLHTDGRSLHLLTKKAYSHDIIKEVLAPKGIFFRIFNKIRNMFDKGAKNANESLLSSDWESIKKCLTDNAL